MGKKVGKNCKKLIPNLHDKTEYTCHIQNLQFYVKFGLKITKIHSILKFNQSRWLAEYIDFNTNMRQKATSAFEKDLYKYLNNSCYGKTMEGIRNRIDVRLVSEQKQAERLTAQPAFESFSIINDDITMVKMRKMKIRWDKPTYLGFCVLELSKLAMYEFHYDYIMQKYGKNAKLMFTDTDSFCYSISTEDIYKDMKEREDLFDTSNYPQDHFLYSTTNARVVGKFKDECAGEPPLEFVGLRSKMYSILLKGDKAKSTAKGVKRSFAKKFFKHQLYKDCLFNETRTSTNFHTIRTQNHKICTNAIRKDGLSPYDDKRYLLKGTTDTLAYGHWKINQFNA